MVDFAYYTWQLSSNLWLCCTPFRPWAFTVSSLVESSLSVTGWHNGDVVNPSIFPHVASICLTINAQPTAGWHHTHTHTPPLCPLKSVPTSPQTPHMHLPSLPLCPLIFAVTVFSVPPQLLLSGCLLELFIWIGGTLTGLTARPHRAFCHVIPGYPPLFLKHPLYPSIQTNPQASFYLLMLFFVVFFFPLPCLLLFYFNLHAIS